MGDVVVIDGSKGEGGGQILRTALALSLVTGRAARVESIRAARPRPGLLRQHLASIRAARAIGARVEGAALGAEAIEIHPGEVRAGEVKVAIGSAGSASLVLQTVLPPLMRASGPSRIVIEGGTHNPFAPTFDFLDRVYLPHLRAMGIEVRAELVRPGFYPAGGGEIVVDVVPTGSLVPIELVHRGPIRSMQARALIANLPIEIAERELGVARRRLGLEDPDLLIQQEPSATGPGNVVLVQATFDGGSEICTGFAERGVRAEKVAARAVGEMERFLAADVPVGVRLADQLMVPMALAGGGSMRTLPLSKHSETNLEVIHRFVETPLRVMRDEGSVVCEVG